MSRTPKPTDSHTQGIRYNGNNHKYAISLTMSGRSLTEAIDAEIHFLRTWNLPAPLLAKLKSKADARKTNVTNYVVRLLWSRLEHLPPATPAPKEPVLKHVDTSLTIHRAAMAWLLQFAATKTPPLDTVGEMINAMLMLSQTYDLPPDALAQLKVEAKKQKCTTHELVTLWVLEHVMQSNT